MGNKVYEIICEDNACSECKKYGGIFSEKPKHIPPFHPNCRCKMIEMEEILEDVFGNLKEFEGDKKTAYTDTKGKVTIGYGSMFNNVERFKKLPLYYQNRLATPEEKEEEFYMLRDKVVRRGYLELPTPEMKALAMEHLKGDLMSVRRKFKDFDNLPKNAQLVILDMEYNMGATKFQSEEGKWPHFFEAIGKRDWFWAGNESGSPDVQLERNEWRKNMLHSIEE